MKFLATIALTIASSLPSFSNAQACTVNLYMSDSTANQNWFSPAYCGIPQWSSSCVNSFTQQAYWRQTMFYDGANSTYRITGGSLAYFIVEYDQESCQAQYNVYNYDAVFMGSQYAATGRLQKLYAVKDAGGNYNLLVNLTRGITIVRQ